MQMDKKIKKDKNLKNTLLSNRSIDCIQELKNML